MNTDQMLQQLRAHPVMCEVGMEMALGFPFFDVRCNRLHVHFFPHCEKKSGNSTTFFKPAYRIEFVYPFRHLCRFDNLALEGEANAGMPVFSKADAGFAREYAGAAAGICRISDLILGEAGLNGCPTAALMAEYRQTVLDAIHILGLSDIYVAEAE